MKRQLILIFTCAIILANLLVTGIAQAQPLIAASPSATEQMEKTATGIKDFFQQLVTDIFPKMENVLTPEQRKQLETAFADGGVTLRKAFKSITLTPEQKTELANIFKSLPKKDIFASLTPEQKKMLFLKKKEFFAPTPEEVQQKIQEKKMTENKD